MERPTVFIGSSTSGLEFANAIKKRLQDDANVSMWNEGIFALGSTFIESLVNALPRFDFAILLLTPDDLVNSENIQKLGPRDNVIFELGLFMGKLGRARTFMVSPSGDDIKIPSDLYGVVMAKYDWPRTDNDKDEAVWSACYDVKKVIHDLGISEQRTSKRVQEVVEEQRRQAGQIDEITRMLVRLVITSHELRHLEGLATEGEFVVDVIPDTVQAFQSEIRRLIALRLIRRQPGKSVRVFFSNCGKKNAKDFFLITDTGREYLETYKLVREAVP